jgi:hypothetical protein
MNKNPLALAITCLVLSPLSSAGSFDFRAETKFNYRYSELNQFATQFPFPPIALPVGQTHAFEETVDSGGHVEISDIALFGDWHIAEDWLLKAKVNIGNLYEKNPTSSDYKVDLSQIILRYGSRHTQGLLPVETTNYFQIGKFGKFERQEDRHLESYGLSGTAFNRLEDSGIETGVDFSNGFYGKFSYTTGNPVFMRDTNALAGDNGINKKPPAHANPRIKTGIPILYDAEVEGFNLHENPETGVGLGYRWLNDSGSNRVNFLWYGYRRNMADTIKLHGTFYGGDLDLLDLSEVIPGVSIPTVGREKTEYGVNVWWYKDNFSVFTQAVKQNVAGLKRDGWEVELSYAIEPTGKWVNNLKVSQISPVVRLSSLDNHFVGNPLFPSPSFWWDWRKVDVGFNTDFGEKVRLTLEYSINQFQRNMKTEENNEYLMTLRWRYD